MFQLIFEDSGQAVFYKVDKETKSLQIKSLKTDYEWKKKPWAMLSDKGIVWLDLHDKDGKFVKKAAVSIDKAIRRGKLRKQHNISKKQLLALKEEIDIVAEKEMKEIDMMSEDSIRTKMIEKMESVGYKLKC